MPAGIHVLDVAQVGIETTRGTLVAATKVLDMDPGGAVLTRDPNVIRIRQTGSYATSHRTYVGPDHAAIEVSGTWSYDWAPWWFNLFLGPLATGTGAGADKTWTFGSAVISDVADNLKSASFELGGKDARPSEYKVAGCIGSKLSLSIKQDAAWTYKATLLGQVVSAATKTGALTPLSAIVDVLGTTTKVYLNGAGSAFGATQLAGVVISADVDIEIGSKERFTLDGMRGPYRIAVVDARKVTAKMVVEYGAQTQYTDVHAAANQRLRIESVGPTLGGSTYRCTLDLPGVWDSLTFGDDDGVVTQELSLTAQYDATPGADINAVVVNASGTLP